MKHLYLAPHLDDAVLSCGGAIHRHTAAGDSVLAVTVFAAEFEGGDPSAFAREQHRSWGNPPRPVALRRAEDVAALARLGAEVQHLDYLDAVYRDDSQGQWLYPDVQTLFAEPHPADPVAQGNAQTVSDQLAALISSHDPVRVYAPLGVGGHVDHQVVHAAARRLLAAGCQMAFYEDYPYAERAGSSALALSAAADTGWRCEYVVLDAADLAAKVSALGYYRSQMAVLFGGAEAMPSRIWAFAATRAAQGGLFERLWWPPEA